MLAVSSTEQVSATRTVGFTSGVVYRQVSATRTKRGVMQTREALVRQPSQVQWQAEV